MGVGPAIDSFYAAKGKIGGWAAAEIAGLKDAVGKLAARFGAPTPEDKGVWEQAKQIHDYQLGQALAQVNALSGPTTWSMLTQDDIRTLEDGYYQFPESDKAGRKGYLEQHPALVAWWDAKRVRQHKRAFRVWG